MLRKFSILAVVMLIWPHMIRVYGSATDNAAVSAAHASWFAGILGDRVVLNEVLAQDVTLRFPSGTEMPRSRFLSLLESGELAYDSAQHQETKIRLYGDTGIVTGRSTLRYRYQGKADSERLAYTAVYVRTSGRWVLVAWQSTNDLQ
jgi:hypothetical protein